MPSFWLVERKHFISNAYNQDKITVLLGLKKKFMVYEYLAASVGLFLLIAEAPQLV